MEFFFFLGEKGKTLFLIHQPPHQCFVPTFSRLMPMMSPVNMLRENTPSAALAVSRLCCCSLGNLLNRALLCDYICLPSLKGPLMPSRRQLNYPQDTPMQPMYSPLPMIQVWLMFNESIIHQECYNGARLNNQLSQNRDQEG